MSALVATNAQRTGAMIALLAVPFAILCNVLLVPPLAETGAAIVAVLPAAGASAVAMTLLARRLGPVIELLNLGKILLATLIVAVIAHLVPTDGLLVLLELAMLGLLALGLAMLMGVLTLADIRPFIPAKFSAKARPCCLSARPSARLVRQVVPSSAGRSTPWVTPATPPREGPQRWARSRGR